MINSPEEDHLLSSACMCVIIGQERQNIKRKVWDIPNLREVHFPPGEGHGAHSNTTSPNLAMPVAFASQYRPRINVSRFYPANRTGQLEGQKIKLNVRICKIIEYQPDRVCY